MVKRGKPWEQNWENVAQLPGGSQGSTSIVKRRGESDEKYVLKILKSQRVAERRERMHKEVKALLRLRHHGLPKIIESNTDEYSDLSVELYFVQEYVDGPTLNERVVSPVLERIQPDEAVSFVIRLSDILIYCHNEGFLHRDIKPNNIILRSGRTSDPVLIDFGLSFNKDDTERAPLTSDGHPIRNKFLSLPELQTNSSKRYKESDISQVCGILFYLLTAKYPVITEDEERRRPHQRDSGKKTLDDIGSRALESLFDRGFEHEPSKRFHSFEAFKGYLHDVLDEFQQARPSNQNASRVTLEAVTPSVRTTLSNLPRQESVRDEGEAGKATGSREHLNFGAQQADALTFASLLGAWNESAEGDRNVIRRLIEGDD
ncbi:MAG: protein kinase [Actinobacteria bacterium]|nr:protein kinase [Actinomycetota bacterium]